MDIITYALCQANDKKLEDLIKSMEGLSTVILDHVPTVSEAEPNKLYLVDVNHDGVYEEYILAEVDGQEQIVELGAFIDLSNYYTKAEVNDLVDVHSELTESEYNALTPEQKKNGKEYFVTGKASELTWKDANNHIVKMEILGWSSTAGLQYAQHITTAPEIDGGNWLIFKSTSPDGVYYHSDLTGLNFPGYPNPGDFSPRADNSDIHARNVYFQIEENGYFTLRTTQGSVYSVYQGPPYLCTPWYNITNYSLDTHFNNKIFKDGEKFAEVNPPASEISFDNVTSGLSAKNVQDAINEVSASSGKHVSLTQAEYDLLTPEEKNNGTEYFITDSESEADISNLENRVTSVENRVLKLEGNFVDITANLQMINPTAYKQVTKVSDNEVYFIVEDPVTEKDYKVTITAQGTGDTRTNPTYTIVEVVPNAEVGD